MSGFGNMGSGLRGAMKPGGTYANAPAPTTSIGGAAYGRYGPDQHQPFRGTPDTMPIPPWFTPPGQFPPGMTNPMFPPSSYGPHDPFRGTPNTNPTPPGFVPPGQFPPPPSTYGPHDPYRGTPNTNPTPPGFVPPGQFPPGMTNQNQQTGGNDYFPAPNPTMAPQQAPGQPQMIPGTNRPMPPGAFIDEYGVPRRAPETPMNPGAGQFGQYTPGPNGFTLDQSGGMNRINGTLFSAEGLNQGGIAAPNYVDYLNRMFRR